MEYELSVPVPVAERSKAWVCGRSPAEIVGSNPTGSMDVFLLSVLCVLSGRGLCDELITRSEESYWLWSVVVCDLETSIMRRPWPIEGCRAGNKQTNIMLIKQKIVTSRRNSIFYLVIKSKPPNSFKISAVITVTWFREIVQAFGY